MRKIISLTKIFSITKKMKKICCGNYGKYRKFRNPEISYISEKTLVNSTIWDKCGRKHKSILEEESVEILGIISLIKNI